MRESRGAAQGTAGVSVHCGFSQTVLDGHHPDLGAEENMTARAIMAAAMVALVIPMGSAQAASSCIFVRNINDFKAAKDEKSMILRDSPSKRYNITFLGRCSGLRFTETIAVRAVGGQFCLTPGDSISFFDAGARRMCMIDKIEPYTPPAPDTAETPEGG
jgi:hypothetical protein